MKLISQQRYIKDTLVRFGLENAKPKTTPLLENIALEKGGEHDSSLPFRNLLECLLWIARCPRPDIMASVIYMAQFCACATKEQFVQLKRILLYMSGIVDLVLHFDKHVGESKDLSVTLYIRILTGLETTLINTVGNVCL